ncbi:hypothetical protein, partial [Methylobacterium sp.]|uniref:hypothetical protein n=1 Tax=Methylobacterium sp. TaxID=409 RepID=UPI0025FFEE57
PCSMVSVVVMRTVPDSCPGKRCAAEPIAPGHSLEGIHVRRDPNGPADRFGRFEAGSAPTSRDEIPAAQPHRKASDAQP